MTKEMHRLVYRAIDKEVTALRQLTSQMVGSLYPGIVLTEIDRLLRAKCEIDRLLETEEKEKK